MTLEELLDLKYDDFVDNLSLFSSHKLLIRNFENNNFIKKLDKIISSMSLEEARSKVDNTLKSLIAKHFKSGYVFEYNEFIIALMFVLKNRHPELFKEIAEVSISTNSAELGSSRRFAKGMLNAS